MKFQINEYADFVKSTTSDESLRTEVMMDRMRNDKVELAICDDDDLL